LPYVKRHGFRRAWYVLRTGAKKPDWKALGGDYFIAPWERKGAVGPETQTKGMAE